MNKQSNAIEIPVGVKRELSKAPKAKALFDKLPPSHKREYLKWIAEAKKPETAQRRLEKMIPMLLAKAS